VLIDGTPTPDADAVVSVFDWVVIRGFGVFEVVRSYGGTPFRLDRHLDRLERSAAALGIAHPGRDSIARWVGAVAEEMGTGQVRVVLTGGGRDPGFPVPARCVVMGESLPVVPARLSLLPMVAPWHPATAEHGFPGVKWVSYAPNMLATDRARAAGFSEALLTTGDGTMLEGPTFTIAWVVDGTLETPSLDLGILPSITRDVVLECAAALGIGVAEGRYPLARVVAADEVFGLSTVKQITPVERIGDAPVGSGPVVDLLAKAFADVVRTETGHAVP
jgi:branched-chain amino acid aminotransferase